MATKKKLPATLAQIKSDSSGFTLLELMIVVSIIGILAVIAVPKFALALQKSKEGSAKGNLGAVRAAVSVYYADYEGQFPASLDALTVNAKYLSQIPGVKGLAAHSESSAVALQTAADDAGGWSYNSTTTDSKFGSVLINCTHTDTSGKVWAAY